MKDKRYMAVTKCRPETDELVSAIHDVVVKVISQTMPNHAITPAQFVLKLERDYQSVVRAYPSGTVKVIYPGDIWVSLEEAKL